MTSCYTPKPPVHKPLPKTRRVVSSTLLRQHSRHALHGLENSISLEDLAKDIFHTLLALAAHSGHRNTDRLIHLPGPIEQQIPEQHNFCGYLLLVRGALVGPCNALCSAQLKLHACSREMRQERLDFFLCEQFCIFMRIFLLLRTLIVKSLLQLPPSSCPCDTLLPPPPHSPHQAPNVVPMQSITNFQSFLNPLPQSLMSHSQAQFHHLNNPDLLLFHIDRYLDRCTENMSGPRLRGQEL